MCLGTAGGSPSEAGAASPAAEAASCRAATEVAGSAVMEAAAMTTTPGGFLQSRPDVYPNALHRYLDVCMRFPCACIARVCVFVCHHVFPDNIESILHCAALYLLLGMPVQVCACLSLLPIEIALCQRVLSLGLDIA